MVSWAKMQLPVNVRQRVYACANCIIESLSLNRERRWLDKHAISQTSTLATALL